MGAGSELSASDPPNEFIRVSSTSQDVVNQSDVGADFKGLESTALDPSKECRPHLLRGGINGVVLLHFQMKAIEQHFRVGLFIKYTYFRSV